MPDPDPFPDFGPVPGSLEAKLAAYEAGLDAVPSGGRPGRWVRCYRVRKIRARIDRQDEDLLTEALGPC